MTDTALTTQAAPKPPITAGGAIAALVPQSLDEAFRLSQALARGGDMVPKHFQDKPEQIMAAILRGAEIGLAPMQALSNIAVINGRATVFGDALPALMQRAGHQLDCVVTGEGDQMQATATLIRGDTGQTIVRTFSAADAKAAQLWGKAGPWQQYKPRMLSMRARTLACRDGAADALMGLQVAEEVRDYPKDITPASEPTPMQRKVAAARGIALPDPVQEAEVMPEEASHWTATVNAEDGFPGSPAFDKGAAAFTEGKAREDCPYDADPQAAADWLAGFDGARRAAK
jgi:ribosome modulation factor